MCCNCEITNQRHKKATCNLCLGSNYSQNKTKILNQSVRNARLTSDVAVQMTMAFLLQHVIEKRLRERSHAKTPLIKRSSSVASNMSSVMTAPAPAVDDSRDARIKPPKVDSKNKTGQPLQGRRSSLMTHVVKRSDDVGVGLRSAHASVHKVLNRKRHRESKTGTTYSNQTIAYLRQLQCVSQVTVFVEF